MITPSFGLTATERVLPKLALDFTTASLDPRITFTRSGDTATYTNSSGVITAINANLPRFDYNPITLVCQGLLIEEARTNIILNSLINGTILNTQIVTTSATAYTLSFYGTGNVVLTGTHSATVTGTGAYPSRKTYTFTPTAGALTLTVSGTVQYAQLEAGSFATSFIPTSATSVTRNADVAIMTGTNFSSWFNATQGSFSIKADTYKPASGVSYLCRAYSSGTSYISVRLGNILSGCDFVSIDAGVVQVDTGQFTITDNQVAGYCYAYKANGYKFSANAANAANPYIGTGTVPTLNALELGSTNFVGHIQKINYYPQALTSNEVQAFSKI